MTEISNDLLFSALESQAERLNKHSDAATAKIAAIEERLASLTIGLEYWLSPPVHRDEAVGTLSRDDTSETLVHYLGFTRVDGKWCLAIKPVRLVNGFFVGDTSAPFQNPYSGGKVVPLLQASRDFRILALQVMPRFLKEFGEHVQTAADTVEKFST